MNAAIRIVERGLVPKPLIRRGIRALLAARLSAEEASDPVEWVETMRAGEIAPRPEKANEQHYELPPAFFEQVLGPRLKYSSAYYRNPGESLADAEDAMLALTCGRADLTDGQDVLELGCGWGSLTLWMAERYPSSRFLAVSNSASQREYVTTQAAQRGLGNVRVVTRDMNVFTTDERFDRVVSVEMFEHMRNWEALLARVATWLRPGGRAFLHVFAHRTLAYPFEDRGAADWMGRWFFTGGMMPSEDLVERLDVPFEVEQRWTVPGEHYALTSEAWLRNLERRRDAVLPILREVHGDEAGTWYHRWRVFFLACAELFAYRGGTEWVVSHWRLRSREGVEA